MLQKMMCRAWKQSVQRVDCRIRQRLAQGDCLCRHSGKKCPASGVVECLSGPFLTRAIGIGLDDRRTFSLARKLAFQK